MRARFACVVARDSAASLTRWERASRAFVRATIRVRWLDRVCTFLQEHLGAWWIDRCTRNLRHVVGLEHVRSYADRSILLVANHRSFFDMFVVNAVLYREGGFHQRFLFPVRANFFYESPLGLFVNGVMSFFSMYPPIFRDRRRAMLNHAAFAELAELMTSEVRSAGLHPEGTRNRGDDPYAFLPAQSGAGRLIHASNAPVIPVFVNGLRNDLVQQVKGNFRRDGAPVVVVFGPPVDFGDLRQRPGQGRTYRALAERAMGAIAELGDVERGYRAELSSASRMTGTSGPS